MRVRAAFLAAALCLSTGGAAIAAETGKTDVATDEALLRAKDEAARAEAAEALILAVSRRDMAKLDALLKAGADEIGRAHV